jgi:hypothetical protein
VSDRELKTLCERGIPPAVRGDVWFFLIEHLKQEHDREQGGARSSDELPPPPPNSPMSPQEPSTTPLSPRSINSRTIHDISADIPRTFPYLTFFHQDPTWSTSLKKLLTQYATCNPDIGYIQGMSFLAAMVLLQVNEVDDAYRMFTSIISQVYVNGYVPLIPPSYMSLYDSAFRQNLPLLYDHFERVGVDVELYLIDWRLSLFSRVLKLDVCVRVWDCVLLHGESFVIKVALGILKTMGPSLGREEDLSRIVKVLREGEGIGVEELMRNISGIRLGGGGDCEIM